MVMRKSKIKEYVITGLKNIGNTCYMNAALQALCNIPQLREYFIQSYFVTSPDEKKNFLSRSFHRLIEDMCERSGKSFLVPSGILQGIKTVSCCMIFIELVRVEYSTVLTYVSIEAFPR